MNQAQLKIKSKMNEVISEGHKIISRLKESAPIPQPEFNSMVEVINRYKREVDEMLDSIPLQEMPQMISMLKDFHENIAELNNRTTRCLEEYMRQEKDGEDSHE